MNDQTPRTILVTGANGGLGIAIASGFLQENSGHRLFLGVRNNREEAEKLAVSYSGRCELINLNVADSASWKAAVEAIIARDNRLDVLVNNAGFHADGLLATLPPESWEAVIQTNLTGVFHGCQATLPTMISQRFGRIINISSLSALLAPAGQANYAAAKAGVTALTQSLAKEVARIGITVNAICPGYIETEALTAMDAETRKAALQRVPMRRFGKPSEVAAAVRFLACAEAGYITGSILKIDGGIF
ncbi:MAG: SDR family oxidoreductase [Verrucomicrobiales bacterium]